MNKSQNKLGIPQEKEVLNQMKYEIASEASHGKNLAELSGSIGGEMTKRLVMLGEEQLKKQK